MAESGGIIVSLPGGMRIKLGAIDLILANTAEVLIFFLNMEIKTRFWQMIWNEWKLLYLLYISFSSVVLHTGKRWFIICPVVENSATDAPEFSPPVPQSTQQAEGPGIYKLITSSSLKLLCRLSSVLTWLSCGCFISFSRRMTTMNFVKSCVLSVLLILNQIGNVWVSGQSQYFNSAWSYKVAEALVTAVFISSVFSVKCFCIMCNFRF